jgi:hypothetical protein
MTPALAFSVALSAHFPAGDWNSVHPHIRYGDDWAVGVYYNSESTLSAYVSYTWEFDNWFIEGGAVTGYSGAPVLPYLRAGYDAGNVQYFVAPALMDGKPGLVFGVEIKVG